MTKNRASHTSDSNLIGGEVDRRNRRALEPGGGGVKGIGLETRGVQGEPQEA